MRFVADIMHEAHANDANDENETDSMAHAVVALSIVDAEMLARVQHLTRTKALFAATDRDNSGSVSRNELFQALRRFKVSVTKKEYREVFRVIDPDQTHSMNMDEWIDFMTATDEGLDSRKVVRAVAQEASFHEEAGTMGGSPKKNTVVPTGQGSPPPPGSLPPIVDAPSLP